VVHAMGGVAAFWGAKILGPRIGKFNKDGSPNAIPGHHLPMAILGTFVLLVGWMGFNGGSTFAGTDLRLTVVIVNTILASAFGCLSAMFVMWRKFGKPDPSMTANGLLAGLVAITAPCAFVAPWAAAVIGIVAGGIVVGVVVLVERVAKVDDPVGAVAVHGANGLWGVLAVGLFADGKYGDGLNGVPGLPRGAGFRLRRPRRRPRQCQSPPRGARTMKRVEAIFRPERLDSVVESLEEAGLQGFTISDARGHGRSPERVGEWRGVPY